MQQLRTLIDGGKHREAAALLEDVDLSGEASAEFLYYAGCCLGAIGQPERAIDLVQRALDGGFAPFWCAYHLGLFEMERGRNAHAACHLAAALILDPERGDLVPLLERVVPGVSFAPLQAAQAGAYSPADAAAALALAAEAAERSEASVAAFYLTTALALDPGQPDTRRRLWQLMPDIPPAVLPRAPTASAPPRPGKMPSASRLAMLANSGKHREAAALLEGADLKSDLPPDFLYLAGVCLGTVNRTEEAIGLLQRAVARGCPQFWCAYHLGLFEEKRGAAGKAASYYTAAVLLEPARADIWERLVAVSPDADFTLLRNAQAAGRWSTELAAEAFHRAIEQRRGGHPGAAACCLAAALVLDPRHEGARAQLRELFPDLAVEALAGIDFDRLTAQLHAELEEPETEVDDLARKLVAAASVHSLIPATWHQRGHAMIPALERVLHRALAAPAALDQLCMLYDTLGFLYFYMAPHANAMRGFADRVVKPFAAAIRDGVGCSGLPTVVPRPLGRGPLRLAYLTEFANNRPGNAVGPFIGRILRGLSRHFPGKYRLYLYAWSNYDDESVAAYLGSDIAVRRFDDSSTAECIAQVTNAVAEDEIDILITDMHAPLPAVLFERRVAPVQVFHDQGGLPFWPLQNLDGVFRIDVYDPKLDGFDRRRCFPLGAGPWDLARLAPERDRERIAAERARLPKGARLIGNYGRLAKMSPEFMSVVAELAVLHPDLVIALGGAGNGGWIREFIAARGLAGRIALIEEFVDGHLWGYLLDVFLDTFPTEGGISRREVMAKGRPVVTMLGPWGQFEAVPMLVARDRQAYIDTVSRLLTDHQFYEAACAATREFVASTISEPDYVAAVDDALTNIVRDVRGA